MFLSELIEAIYTAGYDFNTAQEARRYIMSEFPDVAEEILKQPLSTVQANPKIPDALGFEILQKLSIPMDALEFP